MVKGARPIDRRIPIGEFRCVYSAQSLLRCDGEDDWAVSAFLFRISSFSSPFFLSSSFFLLSSSFLLLPSSFFFFLSSFFLRLSSFAIHLATSFHISYFRLSLFLLFPLRPFLFPDQPPPIALLGVWDISFRAFESQKNTSARDT